MAVTESLDALSTTGASNTPAGTDAVGTDLDDHLRDIKKNIREVAELSQGILAPTGFEGQVHADKSRSGSGIVTLRFHDGGAWGDLFEYDTANNIISAINFAASAVAANAVDFSDVTASAIPSTSIQGGVPVAASQTEQESATATTVFTSPNVQQYHPSAAKGWARFHGDTVSVAASYNVTSVDDSGNGQYGINWATPFSDENYCVVLNCQFDTLVNNLLANIKNNGMNSGWTTIRVQDPSNTANTDTQYTYIAAYGDQ